MRIPLWLLCFGLAWSALPAQSLTIAIGEQAPLLSPNGGIVNRICQEALERMGYTVEFDWLPIGRMLNALQEDSLELYVTPSNTPGQQNPHVDFLAARGVFFYVRTKFPQLQASKLADLAGKRVATVTNSPLKALFEKAGIIVDEGPFDTMFIKLEAGRVDFTATADVGGILTIQRLFPGRETEFGFSKLSYMEIRAGLYAKDTPALRPILQACRQGFQRMKADGSLTRLMQEFFGTANAKKVKIL